MVINRLLEVLRRGSLFDDLYQLSGTPNCEPFVDRFENKIVGFRHVIHDEPDNNFILRPDFKGQFTIFGHFTREIPFDSLVNQGTQITFFEIIKCI